MSKFKVGDVVRRIGGCDSLPVGSVCTVKEVLGRSVIVEETPQKYSTEFFELVRHAYPNPPHKHAEIIKAWADGAEIEVYFSHNGWFSVSQPSWSKGVKYRIRPANPNADKIAELEKTIDQAKKQLQELKNGNS